jgi:hypothetical protein
MFGIIKNWNYYGNKRTIPIAHKIIFHPLPSFALTIESEDFEVHLTIDSNTICTR